MTVDYAPLSEREERFNDVVAAYLDAVEAGQPEDRRALLAEHPDLADDLAAFFAGQDRLIRLATPLRAVTRVSAGARSTSAVDGPNLEATRASARLAGIC